MIALQCLSHAPISLLNPPSQIKPCSPICSNNSPKTRNQAASSSRKSNSRDGFEPVQDSAAFFDENGAVDDMDGYLNYLSLEYDSVWDTKPSWYTQLPISSFAVFLSDYVQRHSIYMFPLLVGIKLK